MSILAQLDEGSFESLFVEHLGWSRPTSSNLTVTIDETPYVLREVATYRGIRVWSCPSIPDRRIQRLIDREVRRLSNERLTIFHDERRQEWRWPQSRDVRGAGQPRLISHEHTVGRENPALVQRLKMIAVGMDEDPSVLEVLRRMRSAFNADVVTRAFYSKFQERNRDLVQAISGIEDLHDREWYSALLMNRLMFIYFMQRKGFMDQDLNYLRNRLAQLQDLAGADHFYDFYKDFLLPLFHEGLGAKSRTLTDERIEELIGDVPYVNGGIFSLHAIEQANDIRVPDAAFKEIFDLFDGYQWHLDDRPTGNPNEINPDVLGYIFEQFINNKEQGAYYTKEDVTHFMTASVLLPAFLQRVEAMTGVNVWLHVAERPEDYLWESLSRGFDVSLPEEIAEEANGQFPRRAWNEVASEEIGLGGESWWEVDARHSHLRSAKSALEQGLVRDADSAVDWNLDLESLCVDVIDRLDNPDHVADAWEALTDIKIIDPTCGSGAFLFAAMKTLEVLYTALLDAADRHSKTSQDTRLLRIIAEGGNYPSRDYYVLKHASLNNLYGVDIMHEAVEIARLRLFLKLVSTISTREELRPLPDLDFNIKVGNVLVGALSPTDVESLSSDLWSSQTLDEVMEVANSIRSEYSAFRDAQESDADSSVRSHRDRLTALLDQGRTLVDAQLHTSHSPQMPLDIWKQTHLPFHWFIEFPEVMSTGGFDVVVGNPPYVSRTRVRSYSYSGFETDGLPDIYAPCVERAAQITHPAGRLSMILPISTQFGSDFSVLRSLLERTFPRLWLSAFSRNPAALFSAGLGVRSTIVVGGRSGSSKLHVTKTHRWYEEFRPALFETLRYVEVSGRLRGNGWIRIPDAALGELLERCLIRGGRIGSRIVSSGDAALGFKQTALYWLSVFIKDPPAYEREDCSPTPQTKIGRLRFGSARDRDIALAMLSSKLSFVWWYCTSDDFDVTRDGLAAFPVAIEKLSRDTQEAILEVGRNLDRALPNHLSYTPYAGKWMGNYVLSECRDITDRVDLILAQELGYEDLLPALEHAYHCAFKPTGERPGTVRGNPCGR